MHRLHRRERDGVPCLKWSWSTWSRGRRCHSVILSTSLHRMQSCNDASRSNTIATWKPPTSGNDGGKNNGNSGGNNIESKRPDKPISNRINQIDTSVEYRRSDTIGRTKIGQMIFIKQLSPIESTSHPKEMRHINQNLNNESIFLRTKQEFSLPKTRRDL